MTEKHAKNNVRWHVITISQHFFWQWWSSSFSI